MLPHQPSQPSKNWLFPSVLFIIAVVIELSGSFGREYLSYQNSFVQNNEYWRLITAHLTHLGWPHFFLNIAGLALVWLLYGEVFHTRIWVIVFLWCSLVISIGFFILDPDLQSYVGLSGVLHGLIASALICSLYKAWRNIDMKIAWEDIFILAGLFGKILYEQLIGPVPLTESASGADVVVNAHLYGTIAGTTMAIMICLRQGSQTE